MKNGLILFKREEKKKKNVIQRWLQMLEDNIVIINKLVNVNID